MNVKRWVQASPSFLGFDVDRPAASNRVACIRALEEQAAYAARGHLRIIEELTGRTYDEIVFTGGAAKGQLWPQIVADVLGVSVRVPVVKESTALGAAIYAGLGAGVYDDLESVVGRLVRFERTFEPDPAARTPTTTTTTAGASSTPGSSACPRPGSSDRCGGRPAPTPPRPTPCDRAS